MTHRQMNEETIVSPDAETQNPAPELVNETPEVTNPEPDADDAEQGDPQHDADRALKKLQRRIDRRTADLYRERAEREQLAQRLAELEAKQQPQEPKQTGLTEADIRARAQEIARIERFNEQCNSIAEKGKKLPDFDKALRTLTTEAGPLIDAKGGPTALMTVVLESENPVQLLHHLGTNPDVAAELEGLSATQLARRLDRIEREMATPKTSKAPKPLEPVKPHSSSAEPSESDSIEDWIRKRNAQVNAKRS